MDKVKYALQRAGEAIKTGFYIYKELPTPEKVAVGSFILTLCALSFLLGGVILF